MKISRTFWFLAILCVSSCDFLQQKDGKKSTEKPKDDIVKSYNKDGSLQSEISIKNGRRNGLSKSYHRNGKVHMEINYSNDIKHGLSKRYYETGVLYSETNYDSGKIDGIQKKFKEDGRPMSEALFAGGFECVGLKEYLVNGELKTNYPKILISVDNKLLSESSYHIKISLSNKVKKVEYFVGPLKNGCLHNELRAVKTENKVGRITYTLGPGQFAMEKINIVAKIETLLGNTYITQKEYNVAIDYPSF